VKKLKALWTKTSTQTLRVLVPSLALKIAKNALFKPKRKPSYWPKHVKEFDIRTRYGQLKAYRYGEGKCIWLVHGWSGSAFDFWPLMQKLAEQGYSTISFDFPAHGSSQGKFSNLPQMIKVFDDVSKNLFAPKMVIAHGIGASAIANSKWFKSYHEDLLLISPVLDIYQFMKNRVYHSGFDQELFNQTIDEVSKREKMAIAELPTIPKLNAFIGQLKIIHDTQDELAPFIMSEKFTSLSKTTLVTTHKLGHKKILHSKKVLNVVESFNLTANKDNLELSKVS